MGGCALAVLLVLALAAQGYANHNTKIEIPQHGHRARASKKIVGGSSVSIKNYPHQMRMLITTPTGGSNCGASLIGTTWALTAAHCCYEGDDGVYRALTAEEVTLRSATSFTSAASGQEHPVIRIVVHANYTPSEHDYDIALLQMSSPVTLSSMTKIIALADESTPDNYRVGRKTYVSGWGDTSEGGSQSKKLKAVMVPLISNEECARLYSDIEDDGNEITDRQFCTFKEGKDSCQGDSGGALVANKTQLGIVSWGEGCAGAYPGVYTRVSAFRQWIFNNTGI